MIVTDYSSSSSPRKMRGVTVENSRLLMHLTLPQLSSTRCGIHHMWSSVPYFLSPALSTLWEPSYLDHVGCCVAVSDYWLNEESKDGSYTFLTVIKIPGRARNKGRVCLGSWFERDSNLSWLEGAGVGMAQPWWQKLVAMVCTNYLYQ